MAWMVLLMWQQRMGKILHWSVSDVAAAFPSFSHAYLHSLLHQLSLPSTHTMVVRCNLMASVVRAPRSGQAFGRETRYHPCCSHWRCSLF